MEKYVLTFLISLLAQAFCFSQDPIKPFEFRANTYVAEISTDTTTIKASVYYFTPEKKRFFRKKFYWLVKDKIIETNANYSGKLLHGEYEEFYDNGQLAIKGKFKNGKKKGSWFHWDRSGELTSKHWWWLGKKVIK